MTKKNAKNGVHVRNGAAASAIAKGTYFLSLTVQNVRCFGEEAQTFDMSDGNGKPIRWTILLGDNGTGKTTLLQALAGFEPADVPNYPKPLPWFLRPRSKYCDHNSLLRSWLRTGVQLQASVNVSLLGRRTLSEDGEAGQKEDNRIVVEEDTKNGGFGVGHSPADAVQQRNLNCYGYGAARGLGNAYLGDPESDDPTANLFSDDAQLRNAHEWLLRLDYSASKPSPMKEQMKKRQKQMEDLLLKVLPDEVEDIRYVVPPEIYPTASVEFKTPYGWVPMRQLGHGYRAVIAWMVDFASRMAERYPDAENPLAQPAVVLVDEIDLHLHPAWQRKLMSDLTTLFPNTQFIVTAHSPLIAQAAGEDAKIVLLRREGDHVVIDNNLESIRGYRIDQVVTSDLFGLPSARPAEFDELFDERDKLLANRTLTAADERKLEEIEAKIGELPAGEGARQAKTLRLIQESIKIIQQKQSEKS